ncbi:MAG: hypothetical protein JNJ71_19800 [Rubrivivax sp.]|nr:hypothetical protein [Rubrivivax sp.]
MSVVILTGAASAHAGPPGHRADLKVELGAPASVQINLPTTYSVTVTNLGGQTSDTITARVSFPLSNTSPQAFILGTVSGLDSRCSVVANGLTCSLAGLRKGWSTTFSYNYAAPVSTKPLQMSVSVSSATPDPVSSNNTASVLPNLVYPARPVSASAMTTRLCTGTTLTSFFECARFPSSISSFGATLNADQTIALAEPGYTGRWSQNAARTSLRMEFYFDDGSGAVKVADFNGMAINGANCFHGLTQHLQSTGYVSPYEVCLP